MNEATEPLFTDAELEAFILNVYKNKYKDGSIDLKRAAKYAGKFMEGVTEGYGKSLSEVDYDTPDYNMLSALANNVFHFSSAKNRAEIIALSTAVRDENGKVRSFASFKQQASAITGEFQGNWLKAEYDLAINASAMAARWVDYSSDKNAILKYSTAHDSRVRPEHRALDGICKPIGDPFWDTYFPPNGWNCRCHALKTLSGKITPNDQIPADAIDSVPPMFRSNFAKEGLIFPPNHPYLRDDTAKSTEQLKVFDFIPYKQFAGGGRVLINKGVDITESDYEDKVRIAEKLAEKHHFEIELLPIIDNNDPIRKTILPNVIGNTNPDYRINGTYGDLKSPIVGTTYKGLRSDIKDTLKQGDIAVIMLPDNPSDELLEEAASSKLKGERRLKMVVLEKKNGQLLVYKKSRRS